MVAERPPSFTLREGVGGSVAIRNRGQQGLSPHSCYILPRFGHQDVWVQFKVRPLTKY